MNEISEAFGKTVAEIPVPSTSKVYEKTLFSMLTPDVESELIRLEAPLGEEGKSVDTAVLFGIEAHVCILQTTKDLISRGYNVHIVADGVSSQRPFDRAVAFEVICKL